MRELDLYGHIYMYRFRPEKRLRAWNSRALPAKTEQTRAIMHQILNNLDPDVAQFPHELITYGGTGSVFQNWGQFRLVMKYLSEMTDEQTLVMYVVFEREAREPHCRSSFTHITHACHLH